MEWAVECARMIRRPGLYGAMIILSQIDNRYLETNTWISGSR